MLYYYLIIALQAFCIFHNIKYKNEVYWFYLIIFIPVLGSIIYLMMRVINKNDVVKVQEGLATVINPTRKVKALHKKLDFSDTFQNTVDLADAYFEINDFPNASKYYETSLESNFSTDVYVLSKLVESLFNEKKYKKLIPHFETLEDTRTSIKPINYMHYGLALDELGYSDDAEMQLKKVDNYYSNYEERTALAEFYINKNKFNDAKAILEEIAEESRNFTKDNRRIYRFTVNKVKTLLNSLD
jgi:hypothetical protein